MLPDIRMDWETYNVDQNDRKLVDVVVAYGDAFPVKDADGNEVLTAALRISDGNIQTAWERNQTPGSEGTSASLQSMIVSKFNITTTDMQTYTLMTFMTLPVGNSYGYDASKSTHIKCTFHSLLTH